MSLQKQESATLRSNAGTHAATTDTQRLRDAAGALVIEFQEKLEQTLRVFKVTAAKQVAHDLPGIADKLLERYSKQHEKLASEVAEQLKSEMTASGTEVGEATSKQLAAIQQDVLGAFLGEAKAAAEKTLAEITATALEQGQVASQSAAEGMRSVEAAADQAITKLQSAREQMEHSLLADHQKLLNELADSGRGAAEAMHSVQSAADEAITKLQSAREQMEHSLLADHQNRLNELAASSLDELAHKAEAKIDAFQQQFDSTLKEFTQKATAKIEQDVTEATAGLLERSSAEMQRQTQEVRESLVAELRNSGSSVLEDTQRQFAILEKASSEVLNHTAKTTAEKAVSLALKGVESRAQEEISRSADRAIARIDAEHQKLRSQAERGVADYQKHLGALALESVEKARRDLESQVEAFRGQLHARAEAFEQKAREKAVEDLPRAAADLVSHATADLEKRGDELLERTKQEIQTSAVSAMEKARRHAIGETEASFRSLADAALDQSRSQLNQSVKDVAAASRKQFELDIEQSFQKQRRSAQAQIDEMARASFEQLRHRETQSPAAAPAHGSVKAQLLLILVAFIPTILFAYLASRPVMRLKASAPTDFLDTYPEWTSSHQDVAVKLGQAYWDWAALHLVPNYPYGSKLPEQPPPLFEVDGSNFPTGVDADVAKMRYWQKLRELWTEPQSWESVEAWKLH